MNEPLKTIHDYTPEMRERVMGGLRLLSICLGSYLDDIVLVGGLVPLLLPDMRLPQLSATGTQDIDIGFSMGVLDEDRYEAISRQLEENDFSQVKNDKGNNQNWKWQHEESGVVVDLLIDAKQAGIDPSKTKHLSQGFGATGTLGLNLAFDDMTTVEIAEGPSPAGLTPGRFNVCGPGSFAVLKALAMKYRNKRKDPYDLFLVLRYHELGPDGIAEGIRRLGVCDEKEEAMDTLREKFASARHVAPTSISKFSVGRDDPNIRQEAYQTVKRFLDRYDSLRGTDT